MCDPVDEPQNLINSSPEAHRQCSDGGHRELESQKSCKLFSRSIDLRGMTWSPSDNSEP